MIALNYVVFKTWYTSNNNTTPKFLCSTIITRDYFYSRYGAAAIQAAIRTIYRKPVQYIVCTRDRSITHTHAHLAKMNLDGQYTFPSIGYYK